MEIVAECYLRACPEEGANRGDSQLRDLLDGVDLFPTTPARSLACRVYATGSGYAGAPTQEQIEAALRGASR